MPRKSSRGSRGSEVHLLLRSTYELLRASKLLSGAGVDHETVATPRWLSSDCGLSIRLRRDLLEEAERVLREGGMVFGVDAPPE